MTVHHPVSSIIYSCVYFLLYMGRSHFFSRVYVLVLTGSSHRFLCVHIFVCTPRLHCLFVCIYSGIHG